MRMGRRIHDPVALARGHRLLRAASRLVVPAWFVGLLGLAAVLVWGLRRDEYESVGLGLALVIGLGCWLWADGEELVVRSARPRGERLPDEVRELLATIDGPIEALEHGEDEAFEIEAVRLGRALERLRPGTRGYLEARGVDPDALRRGVCTRDPEDEAGLSPERRRALHHELVQFAAAIRGQSSGGPYRSQVGAGLGLLAALRDPALARTRRILLVILSVLVIGWVMAWNSLAALAQGEALRWCNPTAEPSCKFAVSTGAVMHTIVDALVLVPMLLLGAAAAARAAAWRCFAVALPESPQASGDDAFLSVQRGRLARRRRAVRVLLLLWLGAGLAVVLEPSDWHWTSFERYEQLIIIALLTLCLVALPVLSRKLSRRGDQRRYRRRIARARAEQRGPLTDLFVLRRALADAAPARVELLEDLAYALADIESLGQLACEERDQLVARLRAAAERGPALSRAQRDRVLLDVEICERLIA